MTDTHTSTESCGMTVEVVAQYRAKIGDVVDPHVDLAGSIAAAVRAAVLQGMARRHRPAGRIRVRMLRPGELDGPGPEVHTAIVVTVPLTCSPHAWVLPQSWTAR